MIKQLSNTTIFVCYVEVDKGQRILS